jgi:aminopeptidase YwaD
VAPAFDLEPLAARLREHVETLAHSPRNAGSSAHRRARGYVRDRLGEAGFSVTEVPFAEGGPDGINVLTQPLPAQKDLPLVVIGAHYDSIAGSPGADDNASAVASLLELARWIGPRLAEKEPHTARLQLVAYDLEEWGYVGSEFHCREIGRAGHRLRGMISLEMLGYADSSPGSQNLPTHLAHLYPDVGDFIGAVGNDHSLALLKTVTEALKTVPDLPVEALAVPGNGEELGVVRLSDHSPFWDQGHQALMITDTSFFRNPHYHRASDVPDTLDYRFLARVTAGVCEATWRLLHE